MIAFIDNKDSFTFNIVQSLERVSGGKVQVFRSEESTVAEIEAAKPTHIVVGPGPGTPLEAGISIEAINISWVICSVSAFSFSASHSFAKSRSCAAA